MTTEFKVKYPDVTVDMSGEDGGTLQILGRVRRALRLHLRELEIPSADIDAEIATFTAEATSGDYNHLLQTVMRWVEVT